MTRTIGFLAGVCLTVAAFVLVLAVWENQPPGIERKTTRGPTPEELSAVVAAIAEQVDVVQAVPPDQESGTADSEPPNGFVETTSDDTAGEPLEESMAIVAQADVVVQAGNESGPAVPPDHGTGTADGGALSRFGASGPDQDHQSDMQAQAQGDGSDREDSSDTGTFLFWSPFRSAWSAQGFAGRLTAATQIPVEVINAGPGKYRVAFSYQDETQRLARIERIETITGLKLE